MSLLPSSGPDTSTSQEGELQVVGVDDDVAPLLDALNSETARQILNEIYTDPGTPSDIADRLDMSIQKVSYHIEKLEEQDLIDVAGTQYSEKGQEMTVYQPPDEPTVLFVGTEERKRSLVTMVKRLLPVVAVVALGSLVVERLFGDGVSFGIGAPQAGGDGAGGSGGDAGGYETGGDAEVAANATATETPTPTAADDVGIMESTETPTSTEAAGTPEPAATSTPTPQPTGTPTEVATETPTAAPDTTGVALDATRETTAVAAGGGVSLSPGLAFFLGGMTVVAVLGAWWAYTTYA